jgi:dipeptide/tripeptide permease
MPFGAKNMRIIALGVVVIVLGYVVMYFSPTMSDMALTVSPILLLLGYCVIVPMGIMAGVRKKRTSITEIPEPTTNGAV